MIVVNEVHNREFVQVIDEIEYAMNLLLSFVCVCAIERRRKMKFIQAKKDKKKQSLEDEKRI